MDANINVKIDRAVRDVIHSAMMDGTGMQVEYRVCMDEDGEIVTRIYFGANTYHRGYSYLYTATPAVWSHETWGEREADSDAERDEWIRDMEAEYNNTIAECIDSALREYNALA